MSHSTEKTGDSGKGEGFEEFVEVHLHQLQSSGVPQIYWYILHQKLKREVYDAGEFFKILCVVQESEGEENQSLIWKVQAQKDLSTQDPSNIFLIDHAWTFRFSECRQQLSELPGLKDRMAGLMGVETKGRTSEDIIEDILQEMWRFNQTYNFGHFKRGSDEWLPYWYIMDEFGSRIQHSDTPSVRAVPFYYAQSQITYTIMWPLHDIEEEDEVTRNFLQQNHPPDVSKAKLQPWVPCDMTQYSYHIKEPDFNYFKEFSNNETAPCDDFVYEGLPKDRKVRVYFEHPGDFAAHLTDERFELVKREEEADIIWVFYVIKDYKKLCEESPGRMVNQFPSEATVTKKDQLAYVSLRAAKSEEDPETLQFCPKWLPVTFNLNYDLPQFVSYFQNRAEKGLDNTWICKPWNLARGMDIHVTNNINQVIRSIESGPKIASKYIEDPVLFCRDDVGNVKFDIRYILLLSSVKPLKLFAYKVFWLRFANQPFSLDHFDCYEKHFTVMNYANEGKDLKQIHYDDFIPMFESQHPAYSWEKVEESIFNMFRELFVAATEKPPSQGLGHSPQSRAMYAADLMLKWSTDEKGERIMQPVLCEVNRTPDCDRACKYHPFFTNDVFSVLFMDETEGHHVVQL